MTARFSSGEELERSRDLRCLFRVLVGVVFVAALSDLLFLFMLPSWFVEGESFEFCQSQPRAKYQKWSVVLGTF